MRLALIGAAVTAASLLYSALAERDEEYVGPSNDGPTAEDVMDLSMSAILVTPATATVIQQGEARIETDFGAGWISRRSGRQIQFRNQANTAVCQSLVMPLAEYRGYVGQFGGRFEQYKRAEIVAGMSASGASVSVDSASKISGNKANWEAYKFVIRLSNGERYTRRTYYTALSTNQRHAAMLSCAYAQDFPNDNADLAGKIRAYGLYAP